MIRKKHITLCFSLFLALSMFLGQLIPVTATNEVPTETPVTEQTASGAEEPVPVSDPEPTVEDAPAETPVVETGPMAPADTDPEEPEEPVSEEESIQLEKPAEDESYPEKMIKTRVGEAEIIAKYDSTSGIPKEAVFKAEEVTGETADVYKDWSNSTLDGEVTFAQFFDIWFEHEGQPVQPVPGTVKISIQYPEALEKQSNEEVSVVHFPDDAAIEVLDEAKIEQTDTQVKTVELAASSFSVYGIVGTEKPVIEFTFYAPTAIDGNGKATYGKYSYIDQAGNNVDTQYVANGARIEYPGKPIAGFDDYVFEDWYYGTYDETGIPIPGDEKVDFETSVTVTAKEKKPIVAKYIHAKYGVFYDDAEGKTILAHVRYVDGKIEAGAVTATPSQANTAFVGWTTTKGSQIPIELDAEGNYSGTETQFYPIFKEAYTLTFSTGEGSYVKPQTIQPGEKAQNPDDPHRTGYTFGGWYEDLEGTKAFDFNKPISGSLTLYAKWNPAQTSYTVIYWLQSINDRVDSNPKTYEYSSSEVKQGATDSVANVTDSDISTHKPAGNTVFAAKDENVSINGDGSTVVNVYYDREIITYIFKGAETFQTYQQVHSPSWFETIYGQLNGEYVKLVYVMDGLLSGHWEINGNKYNGPYFRLVTENRDITLKGLYGTSFEQNNLKCPEGPWEVRSTGYPFITHFIDPGGQNRSEVTFTKASVGSKKIQIYLQNTEGNYSDTPDIEQPMQSGASNWTFTEVINGFTVDSYYNAGNWQSVVANEKISDLPDGNFKIRYRRNLYDLNFLNGSDSYYRISIPFEEAIHYYLNNSEVPIYPGHPDDASQYEFVGWFADPQCTTLVNFGNMTSGEIANIQNQWGIEKVTDYIKMPASPLEVYAGWFRKQFNVNLDLNGGTLVGDLPLKFKARYGDELAGDYFTTPVKEGYSLVGWARTETISSGAPEYWNPLEQVVSDINLTAVWKANGSFQVKYYDENHDLLLEELNTEEQFADNSVVSLKKPHDKHIPANKVFHGWQILGKEKSPVGSVLKPGESFVIDAASMARNNNEIHVQMVTTAPGTTTLTYHKNDGSTADSVFTVNDIALNTNVSGNKQKPISQFPDEWKREGLEFFGWNTKPDGSGEMFLPGTADYAVNANDSNDLYAQYKKIFKVTIKKTVNGSFGDRLKFFTFTMSGTTNDQDNNFKLKHDSQKEVNVYEGNNITVSEDVVKGYKTSIKVTSNGSTTTTDANSLNDLPINADTEIEFINTKEGTVPTGINDGDLIPYLGALIIGLGIAIMTVLRLRKAQMES